MCMLTSADSASAAAVHDNAHGDTYFLGCRAGCFDQNSSSSIIHSSYLNQALRKSAQQVTDEPVTVPACTHEQLIAIESLTSLLQADCHAACLLAVVMLTATMCEPSTQSSLGVTCHSAEQQWPSRYRHTSTASRQSLTWVLYNRCML